MYSPLAFVRLLVGITAVLAPVANALPQGPTSTLQVRSGVTFNPVGIELSPLEDVAAPVTSELKALTNAERLARGLPLLKPRSFKRGGIPYKAKRASTSATPTSITGNIKVTSTDGTVLGYVASSANAYGEYGLTEDVSQAMSISFGSDSSAPFDITATNGISSFPYMGLIEGIADTSANLRAGSFNYAYLGGSAQTAPGSVPQVVDNSFNAATHTNQASESAVWLYDSATGSITGQWINADGSSPAMYLLYVPSASGFAYSGDINAFRSTFGTATEVAFTLV